MRVLHPIGSRGRSHGQGPPHIEDPIWADYWCHLPESIAAWCPHVPKGHLAALSRDFPAGFLQNPVVALLLLEDPGWPAVTFARYRAGVQALARNGIVSPLHEDCEDGAPPGGDTSGNGTGYSYGAIGDVAYGKGSGYGDGHCGYGDGNGSGHGDHDDHDEGSGAGRGSNYEDGTGNSSVPDDHGNGDGNGAQPIRRWLVSD